MGPRKNSSSTQTLSLLDKLEPPPTRPTCKGGEFTILGFPIPLSSSIKKRYPLYVHSKYKRAHTHIVTVAVISITIAFFLQLLVALSLPLVRPVYLFSLVATTVDELPATDIATEVRFGVWGYCATSVLNQPTLLTNTGECSSPQLGYNISSTLLTLVGGSQLNTQELIHSALKVLIIILILHPINALLCFISLLLTLCAQWHFFASTALVVSIITASLSTISCAIDLTIVILGMKNVGLLNPLMFAVRWGNAPWMSLIATVFLWTNVGVLSTMVYGCCGISRDFWVSSLDEGDEEDRMIETRL